MADRENCRVCGAERPADAPSGLCPACLFKAGIAEEKTAAYVATAEQPGSIVAGRYKLLEQIGEGGMGEVWVADQLEPIRRRVALKLIKPGMDSRSVLGRFEAERQALAVMDHPNIAKVLDAGATADGRPYFVMELVKGTPITEFCDARKLTPKQRLELFVPVCQAIQHAHMKGIIHRDIKPSNVLVALHDETPVAKVIDFGVAKAVGQQLTEKTIYTGFGALVGTPVYMAPEQATFNQLDVDTRADVYALGVLLYELLAGSPPIEKERLKQAALDEVLRIVRDEEPPRPSQRLSTSQAKASIAATRQSDPARLSALMKGEIDWIVMKALEKDRTRRYDTANGLARDIQRYLAGDSVEACPPTLGYRLRKAYRKNRVAVRVASAFVTLLIAAVAVSTWLAVKAKQAKAVADANALRASGNAGAAMEALEASELSRIATELLLASRQVDIDLLEMRTDSRVAFLCLARTLQNIPDHRKGIQIELSSGVEVMGTDRLHPEPHPVTMTGFGSDAPDDLLVGQRALREFVTAAVIATGQNYAPLLPPITHDGLAVNRHQVSPDHKTLLTVGADGTARLWDMRTGQQTTILRQGDERVVNAGYSSEGKTIFTDDQASVARFWESSAGLYQAKTEPRENRYVYPASWPLSRVGESLDHRYYVNGGAYTTSMVVKVVNGRALTRRISFDRVADVVFPSFQGPVELWNTHTGGRVVVLDSPNCSVDEFQLLGGGRWVSAIERDNDHGVSVLVFSAEDGQLLARLNHAPKVENDVGSPVEKVFASPSGRWIAAILPGNKEYQNRIHIWDTRSWKALPVTCDCYGYPRCGFLTDDLIAKFVEGSMTVYRTGHAENVSDPFVAPLVMSRSGDKALSGDGRIYDTRNWLQVRPPDDRKYHPDIIHFGSDTGFVGGVIDGNEVLIDTQTEKHFRFGVNWSTENMLAFDYLPSFGFVMAERSYGVDIRIVPTAQREFPPTLLQLWTQVVVRGELGSEGEFVPWDEQTWEQKRQELAAIPPPYPDLPFPGYVATDKLHWLRAEYEAAPEKDKLRLASELLSRAEDAGDKAEAVRWRAVLAPKASPAEPVAPE